MDLIRKLEQGRRHTVSIGNLHRIARALDVDAGDLLGKTQPLPDPGEHFGAVAIRRALTQVDDLIGDEPDVEPLTLDDARRALTYGWGAYWAGRYDRLGHLLPGAIGRLRATVRRPAPTTAPAPREVVTENHGAALTAGRRMPPDAALPVAARARHLSDLALAHTRLGRDGAALDVLLTMEHLAPDWTRYQAQPRQIVRELRERAGNPPRSTALAQRMGVARGDR